MNRDKIATLEEIERRVLWLAVRMVDSANNDRPNDGVKVGGHQASSASMVTIMTSLWFAYLNANDRVSVKPHAAPVHHAIQYLLGNLDVGYMTRLRALGGLQAYPSRTKDPDRVDFSTGSVGLGAAAPLFAAVARRYVDAHFGERPKSRFISVLGDAELDEGNIWEAIADPATSGLGNALWIVDLNRQSLDRVVPGVRITQWRGQFEAAGWHVVEAKYGAALRAVFERPGGDVLRQHMDRMSNEQYQSLFALSGQALRERLHQGAPQSLASVTSEIPDEDLRRLITDLGGHDMSTLLDAYSAADAMRDRPTVVFAYTVKGWSLPTAGSPNNHSTLLSAEAIDGLRSSVGLSLADEWERFEPGTAAAALCAERRLHLELSPPQDAPLPSLPTETELRTPRPISTQEAFGRTLLSLARNPEVAPFLVTSAPDVATSTNLAGYINRAGVFHPEVQPDWDPDSLIKWNQGPSGHHIELGISEMNLFLLLGQLGLAGELSDQRLLPIGTVYDPFVLRGLDALIYSVYSGARFIFAGSPSGITLAPEGGAHQSTITPSVGLELPGLTCSEPAFARALNWMMCDALRGLAGQAEGASQNGSYYFRLSTRPVDQSAFDLAEERLGSQLLRRQVLDGGYRLVDAAATFPHVAERSGAPRVSLVGCGAVLPQLLDASTVLAGEGILADVVDVTSNDLLYRAWRDTNRHAQRRASAPALPGALRALFPDRAPMVSVHDASSHTMAWFGSALGVPMISLGVDQFGQSGTVSDLYQWHGIDTDGVVNGALSVLSLPNNASFRRG